MATNSSDTQWALVAETVVGTTPATPSFLVLDYIIGDEVNIESDWLESNVLKANRGHAGGRRSAIKVTGSLKSELFRDAGMDLLLESGVSGAFATNILKGGASDKSFTLEKKILNGATTLYQRFTACQVAKTTISGSANGMIEVSFDIIGVAETHATAIILGATYANAASTAKLAGLDTTVTIAGLTVDFDQFEISVEFNRSHTYRFGTANARGVQTEGARKVSGNVRFFREDWTPEETLTDAGVALTVTCGTGVNGYAFNVPGAQFQYPKSANEGAAIMATADFMGKNTTADATNIKITKLA